MIAAKSRWCKLLPVAFITYRLANLNRTNVGSGKAGGTATD
jgi:hypothetical protein